MDKLLSIILRYSILLMLSLGNLYIFYLIFTPLTIYFVYFISNLFSDVSILGNVIIVNGKAFKIIQACVAGSAYFLLLVLNLSIQKINIITRVKAILFSFILFFSFNILRILILILILFKNPEIFILSHKIFWYFLSTIFIVLIWLAEIKIFKIKEIPFYSDIIYLKKKSIFK